MPTTETIYFLLVDRFHNGNDLLVSAYTKPSFSSEKLKKRMGGNLLGVIKQLPYLKDLGIDAIWMNPIMENPESVYHGYAIQHFLKVDPRLGTLDELKLLVIRAHELGIKIYLDVVLNHTADTWSYKEENPQYTGSQFEFGTWHSDEYPQPEILRNVDWYERKGMIQRWDDYPETREGDIFELKTLKTGNNSEGKAVRKVLLEIYTWWIEQTQADGFRIDTIKHLSPGLVNWFSNEIKSFTTFKKKPFVLFGEAIGDYSLFAHYTKLRWNEGSIRKGLDQLLDFPLHFKLPEVFLNNVSLSEFGTFLRRRQQYFLKTYSAESSLIGFLDNHDQVAQSVKSRITKLLGEQNSVCAYSMLHFICPAVQLYYGTEQGLAGSGKDDVDVREPMFEEGFSFFQQGKTWSRFRKIHEVKKTTQEFFATYMEISIMEDRIELTRSLWDKSLHFVLSQKPIHQEIQPNQNCIWEFGDSNGWNCYWIVEQKLRNP